MDRDRVNAPLSAPDGPTVTRTPPIPHKPARILAAGAVACRCVVPRGGRHADTCRNRSTRLVAAGTLGPTDDRGARPFVLRHAGRDGTVHAWDTLLLPPLLPPAHPDDDVRPSPMGRTRKRQ